MDMTVFTAVLGGNLLTALCAWGLYEINKSENGASWIAYGAALLFPAFLIGGLLTIGELPPQFDALRAQ